MVYIHAFFFLTKMYIHAVDDFQMHNIYGLLLIQIMILLINLNYGLKK